MKRLPTLLTVTTTAVASIALPLAAAGTAAAAPSTTYVSPFGHDSAHCGTFKHPCRTIGAGLAHTATGGTVAVARGTYREEVKVHRTVTLIGQRATIDAFGKTNGLLVEGARAAGSSVSGFTVENARGSGVAVQQTANITLRGNRVLHNDLGVGTSNPPLCASQGEVPGDCGEAVYLTGVHGVRVVGNQVRGNVGGILVTDDLGPTHHNLIEGNVSADNRLDCGITLPGHSPNAVDKKGHRQPTKGGVYDNLVLRNTVVRNGAGGEGAGVLIAAAQPGSASYDNTVAGNVIRDNTLPGVTIHSHAPQQDVSGNVVIANRVGRNALAGDPDAKVKSTTGVLVFSAVVPVKVTISGNLITDNTIGIWLSKNVTARGVHANTFRHVIHPIVVH